MNFGMKHYEDYVVFDIETNGGSPIQELVEIAAIKVHNGEIVSSMSYLVIPDSGEMNPHAMEKHGISAELATQHGISKHEAVFRFAEFAKELPLVGHNIHNFDILWLNAAAEESELPLIENESIDTLERCKEVCACGNGLDDVCSSFNLELEGIPGLSRHRALYDSLLSFLVYEELKNRDAQELTYEERVELIASRIPNGSWLANTVFDKPDEDDTIIGKRFCLTGNFKSDGERHAPCLQRQIEAKGGIYQEKPQKRKPLDYVVVGDRGWKLSERVREGGSSSILKARKIAQEIGHPVKVIFESDLLCLLEKQEPTDCLSIFEGLGI
ncbi:MAG: hypothetical protein IKV56_01555 [Kiritimatiellae bacterium]|nr:hypothetical protein [Kiritimatiellia bacterium]